MKETLLKYGFHFIGACHCEGFATDKYGKGDYEVRTRDKKGLFKFKHLGRSKTLWIPSEQLEQVLKNINQPQPIIAYPINNN